MSRALVVLREEAQTLEKQLRAINSAIATLEGTSSGRKSKPAAKRNLSAASRKKLSEAAKRRWAKVKK